MVGIIAAGEPIEAVAENETCVVPANFVVQPNNSYVLKVRGRSMIEDGIFDGDYVIVERNPSPKNGDIVVALLDNAYATLKRFYREAKHIRLQPANRSMAPLILKGDVNIQGVVRGVMRKF
jgi:SOS regulatory protein LexA